MQCEKMKSCSAQAAVNTDWLISVSGLKTKPSQLLGLNHVSAGMVMVLSCSRKALLGAHIVCAYAYAVL